MIDPYEAMPVHDERIPEDEFAAFIERMPQVCVDLVLETDEGVLLADRQIEPAVWFWPGSRLYKGEALEDAARRVAREELGIEATILGEYGPYAHFWEHSPVNGSPSRHTVNTAYHVEPAADDYDIELDDQHADVRYVTVVEDWMHEYVQRYLRDIDALDLDR